MKSNFSTFVSNVKNAGGLFGWAELQYRNIFMLPTRYGEKRLVKNIFTGKFEYTKGTEPELKQTEQSGVIISPVYTDKNGDIKKVSDTSWYQGFEKDMGYKPTEDVSSPPPIDVPSEADKIKLTKPISPNIQSNASYVLSENVVKIETFMSFEQIDEFHNNMNDTDKKYATVTTCIPFDSLSDVLRRALEEINVLKKKYVKKEPKKSTAKKSKTKSKPKKSKSGKK